MPSTIAFGEIEPVSLREKVVATLKDAFFSAKLRPGDLIVERQLAEQMKIGTPAIREALITLQEQGFVRRVANTATYVNKFTLEELRQLYSLRVEFELLALQWAKPQVTEADLHALERMVEAMVGAAQQKNTREHYHCDLQFHRLCWKASGNKFLVSSLERLVAPLFAFVLCASDATVEVSNALEHLNIVKALRDLQEPEFSSLIRSTLTTFSLRGTSSMLQGDKKDTPRG